jgi:phage baseplate assembly protein gpV
MAVTAKINSNNSSGTHTARINSNTSSGAQKVSIAVPSATAAQTLKKLNDVNVTSLSDGALLQYDAATDKFTARNELNTTTGKMTFNGGAF